VPRSQVLHRFSSGRGMFHPASVWDVAVVNHN
jgi:hypothetical protein